jgi:multiple sugar transport system substrate-binding protein
MGYLLANIMKFLQNKYITVRGRYLYLLVSCLLGFQLFSSCNKLSENNKVELNFFVRKEEVKNWANRIKEFEYRNKNISIKLKNEDEIKLLDPQNTDDLRSAYKNSCERKEPLFDLMSIDVIWLQEYAKHNCLLPLENNDFPDLDSDYLNREVYNGMYEGKLYRIPLHTDIGVLFYRRDLLKQSYPSGIETFNQLLDISQKLKNQKGNGIKYGYLWQGSQYEGLSAMFLEVLKGYGGFWIKEKNKKIEIGLKDNASIKAIQFLKQTIYKNISPKSTTDYREYETRSSFKQGKVLFMRNWPNVWVDVNDSVSKIRGKVGIQQMVHAEKGKGSNTIGGWGLGIAKN